MNRFRTMRFALLLLTITATMFAVPLESFGQCSVLPGSAVIADDWDATFTQDGPGKGLEPSNFPGWTGGDSTYSLLLPNGDSAFFFSDSYIGESPAVKGDGTVTRSASGLRTTAINCREPVCDPAASIFIARNSVVVRSKDGKHLRTLVGPKNESGLSTSYFKDPGNGIYFWVGDAIVLPAKAKVAIFLHKFDKKLEFRGASIAMLDAETLAIESIKDISGLPNLKIHWGTSIIRSGPYFYIYGKGTSDGKKQVFVAKTSIDGSDGLVDTANWTVWNGRDWVKGLTNAAVIVPTNDSISDEFDVVRAMVNGKQTFLLVAMDTLVPFGKWKDITLYSSCLPQGPFVGKHKIYVMPEAGSFKVPGIEPDRRLAEHLVLYNPHIHEQFSDDGNILISYNLNRTHNSDSIFIDGYRPRFIRVNIDGLQWPSRKK